MTSNDKRFAVFGAGALGCYFAAVLARSGHRVAVIARGPHLGAIRRSGICVESSEETFTVTPQQVSDMPADIGSVDAVILAVKAWQVPEAARAMRPLLTPTTKVLPLQNGVEATEQLQEVLGKPYPLFGLCRIVSMLVEPGRVRHIALQPTVALGETDGGSLSTNAQALADALASAGVAVQTPPNIQAALWEKLLFIAALSGIGTVARVTVGEIRQCSATRDLMQQVMEEVAAVAKARHIVLRDDVVRETLAFIDQMPPQSTASMQRDIIEGRPSEIEAILGVVARLGMQLGVAVPATKCVYGSLLPQEQRVRASSERQASTS